jgi:hypothetical protein
MNFELYPLRFEFTARDSIYFAPGKPGNILRGAFGIVFKRLACAPECSDARTCGLRGSCAYARIFEPAGLDAGPSGLSDWPRPFAFRARHLDGVTVPPGGKFRFDVNVFEMRDPAIPYFVLAFHEIAREGLGPGRGRAVLDRVSLLDRASAPATELYDGNAFLQARLPPPLMAPLDAPPEPVNRIRVDFLSPTEFKSLQRAVSTTDFPVLFGRVRDRLSTLRDLYGAGPLEIDFKGLGERAAKVRTVESRIVGRQGERRSSRTGQSHGIGGFVGHAVYEGDLGEFVPYLKAAVWTGVGRHTAWGNGEISVA